MRTLLSTVTTLVFCILTGFGVTAQDVEPEDKTEAKAATHDLSPKFEKDASSRYDTRTVITTTTDFMGQKTKSSNTSGGVVCSKCTAVDDDGNATIEFSHDRLIIKSETNGEVTVDYDSEEDKLEDLAEAQRMAAILKDYTFTTTVSPDGKVTKVEGFDKYLEGVKEQASEAMGEMYVAMMKDDIVRDAVGAQFYALRKEPVKVGESWEYVLDTKKPMIGDVTYTRTYTFKEVAQKSDRTCAHLVLKGDITTKEGAIVQFKDVDWTGDVWVDLETREVVYEETVTKFTQSMTLGKTQLNTPCESRTTTSLIIEAAEPVPEDK
jgi:hypothetical protein